MTRHVFLIGFMGSGKTHWGHILAERLGVPFLDLDAFIETGEGKSIAAIFEVLGENGFRASEREYLHRVAAMPPTVIATGGGTPCFFNNMPWMKQHGTTIYLKTSPEILFGRLKNERMQRPLLKNLSEAELRDFIRERLEERGPFYRRADFIWENPGDERLALEKIVRLLDK